MAVYNVHERLLPGTTREVGALIDGLASADDRLWPGRSWPRMILDRPLAVGATGGHGPIRYAVTSYAPGEWVRFTFSGPRGFRGFHEFTVHPADGDRTLLRHTLAMTLHGLALLSWPFAFRPLHDACIEDSLDAAARALGNPPAQRATWSRYVHLLRNAAAHRRPRSPHPAQA